MPAGFVLLWLSVVVIPLGTRFQTESLPFAEYERRAIADTVAANSGFKPHAGFLAFAWPFAGCFCLFIGLLFSGGVLVVRCLAQWDRTMGLLAAVVFGLGCHAGTLLGFKEAVDSFHWGFVVLGMGYLLSAAGLAFGAAGAILHAFCLPPGSAAR
jgi:hypothetical protein